MKTIGLIGGMSWESSAEYYRLINTFTREKIGGLHSARSVMISVDFSEIERMQHQARWAEAAQILADAARSLERAGADFILLCTNTLHKVAADVQAAVRVPLLHIADVSAERIKARNLVHIGLLGTRFTMEEDFYVGRLEKHGLHVLVPNAADREMIHRVIFEELCLGEIKASSKSHYLAAIKELIARGAEAILLACTEIGLLIHDDDCEVPVFDTTRMHAQAAVELALSG